MSEDNPDLPSFFGDSKLEYMEETLKLFRQKYKNIKDHKGRKHGIFSLICPKQKRRNFSVFFAVMV